MKTYSVKTKFFGYKIGLNNDYLYVAVPAKYFDNGEVVNVNCEGEHKLFIFKDKAHETTLKDKFDPDKNYTLFYFLWKK